MPVQPVEQRQEACRIKGVSTGERPSSQHLCAPLFGLMRPDISHSQLQCHLAPRNMGKAVSSCFQPWSSASAKV